jgi:hypothetical protein
MASTKGQAWQPERHLRKHDHEDRHHDHRDEERQRALEDIIDRAFAPHRLDDIERHAHRRRDERDFAHQHDEDAEPDGIDADRRHQRENDRHRSDQHRQGFEEHTQQKVEHEQHEQQSHLRCAEIGDEGRQRLRDAQETHHEIEIERHGEDENAHRGRDHRGDEALVQHLH